jgi:hypothetical protein
VHYSVEPGSQGKAGYVYFVCDQDYDLKNLDSKGRWSVRKGLRNCQVRPMSFDELHRLGMPLNLDTLARQRRDAPMFRNPDRWMRFCQGGEQVEGAQVRGGELHVSNVTYPLDEAAFQSGPHFHRDPNDDA